MKSTIFMLGAALLIAAPMAPAGAGPCTSEIDRVTKVLVAPETGSGSGPSVSDLQMGQHPPMMTPGQDDAVDTATQKDETDHGGAGMTRETTGSSAGTGSLPAETPKEQIEESHSMAGAMTALELARSFDREGKENECLSAVGMAKLISGLR